jgi:hypothetical protein
MATRPTSTRLTIIVYTVVAGLGAWGGIQAWQAAHHGPAVTSRITCGTDQAQIRVGTTGPGVSLADALVEAAPTIAVATAARLSHMRPTDVIAPNPAGVYCLTIRGSGTAGRAGVGPGKASPALPGAGG